MKNNPFSLKNKTVIITGASSGIGKQCAVTCTEMEAKVILIARDKKRLQDTFLALKGENHSQYAFDLLDFDNYSTLVQKIIKENGKISGLIHSAGINEVIPLASLKKDKISKAFDINTVSFFELVRYFSKNKHIEGNVSFVAISSVMGILGQKGALAYCASKAALTNGIKALALELVNKKIRVNGISPAIIETPMVEELFSKMPDENRKAIENAHPAGFGSTEDVANACIYLLSDAAKWVTGSNLVIDGGYSIR